MEILVPKLRKFSLLVEGSPEYIATYIQKRGSSLPKGALLSDDKETTPIPTFSSEEEKREFINDIRKKQKEYVTDKILKNKKGAYQKLIYMTTLSKGRMRVTKTTVRLGVKYNKIKAAAASELSLTKLPWGEWDKDFPLYLINHNGETYLRCSLSFSPAHKKEEAYYDKGDMSVINLEDLSSISKDELIKENKGHPTSVFNVNIKNIIKL